MGQVIDQMTNEETKTDPFDLIEGTIKLDGERHHGYGCDTLRAWALKHDSDSNTHLLREDIEQANQEVKLFRGLIRVMLGHVTEMEDVEPVPFHSLTIVDRVMMCKVLKFAVDITELYEAHKLSEVYAKL